MRDWAPFDVTEKVAPGPRSIESNEGIADRLRAAAFAEIQAREAFLWAAENFGDASLELKRDWLKLAKAEDRHLSWLLNRLSELGFSPGDRPVSNRLWNSFLECTSARQFALFMASAEERGRRAGERFHLALEKKDPVSAEIFRKIAEEEVEHIELALKYFS